MIDAVHELLVIDAAAQKLGTRGISRQEVEQMIDNRYLIAPNRRRPDRRLLIGNSDGGRALTLVVERTLEPTTWLVVIGWTATSDERKMLNS